MLFCALLFIPIVVGDNFTNMNLFYQLPEIKEGESCVPGRSYRMECNKCFCKADSALLCTKMLCMEQENVEEIYDIHKRDLRAGENKHKRNCTAGTIYSSKKYCQRCLCDENKEMVCKIQKKTCDSKLYRLQHLRDVGKEFTPSQIEQLSVLRSRHLPCEPGKAYKIDCNACVCLNTGNFLCDHLLCLSYNDRHRIDANQLSGKNCTTKDYVRPNKECMNCDCINKKSKCIEVIDCITKEEKQQKNWVNGVPKLTLDVDKEQCIAGAVYKQNCNNCYCQEDLSLRCTQKTCLSYKETNEFEKLRLKLDAEEP